MSKVSKSVLNKIKKENIAPVPRWQVVAKNIGLWVGLAAVVVLGSMATGLLLRQLFATEWEHLHRFRGGPLKGFLVMLPYVWFVVVGAVTFLAYKVFEKTPRGYRVHPLAVVGGAVLISIITGALIHSVRFSDDVDDFVRRNVSPYAQLHDLREKEMLVPENGMVVGKIVKLLSDEMFVLADPKRNQWNVEYDDAEIDEGVEIEEGHHVLVIGEWDDDNEDEERYFEAEKIKRHRLRPPLKKMKQIKRRIQNR